MARIRKIEIANFRGIRYLCWFPSNGINCLIGIGDSGKSTILDAIDLCLGARRTAQFTDADFHNLDVDASVSVTLTIGALDDTLKNLDSYGLYLRGFNTITEEIEDEPEKELESVLTLNLTVRGDHEPVWTLVSDRAKAQNATRNLNWGDRNLLAPTRIGTLTDYNLGWRRGSVLNRLTDEKVDASATLAGVARDARAAFGEHAEWQLGETLRLVGDAAKQLGIGIGDKPRALLDTHSLAFGGGTISLHDESGVPLRGLGIGSTRLLIAGLQRKAAGHSPMLLVDEVEHGLEPHRIIRFLGSLGAKEDDEPLQVFMTTHSPVVLRELAGSQLMVLRETDGQHEALAAGTDNHVQSAIRLYPEAFLATSVMVCEGASEVGIIRGLDQYLSACGDVSVSACGVALVDGKGESKLLRLANAFLELRYHVAILRDDDVKRAPESETTFADAGGVVLTWRDGRALEDELFISLPPSAVGRLVEKAVDLHGEDRVDHVLKSASSNDCDLATVRDKIMTNDLPASTRRVLGKASRTKPPWFKNVSTMEEIGREIVGPCLNDADRGFQDVVSQIFRWARDV